MTQLTEQMTPDGSVVWDVDSFNTATTATRLLVSPTLPDDASLIVDLMARHRQKPEYLGYVGEFYGCGGFGKVYRLGSYALKVFNPNNLPAWRGHLPLNATKANVIISHGLRATDGSIDLRDTPDSPTDRLTLTAPGPLALLQIDSRRGGSVMLLPFVIGASGLPGHIPLNRVHDALDKAASACGATGMVDYDDSDHTDNYIQGGESLHKIDVFGKCDDTTRDSFWSID